RSRRARRSSTRAVGSSRIARNTERRARDGPGAERMTRIEATATSAGATASGASRAGDPGVSRGATLLVLSRSDVRRLMDYADYVAAVEAALCEAAEGRALAPAAAAFHLPQGAFHAKAAALLGKPARIAIKLNGNFPDNPAAHGLP